MSHDAGEGGWPEDLEWLFEMKAWVAVAEYIESLSGAE